MGAQRCRLRAGGWALAAVLLGGAAAPPPPPPPPPPPQQQQQTETVAGPARQAEPFSPGLAPFTPSAAAVQAQGGPPAAAARRQEMARAAALAAWWRALPGHRPAAGFGALVVRAGLHQLGRPYGPGMWDEIGPADDQPTTSSGVDADAEADADADDARGAAGAGAGQTATRRPPPSMSMAVVAGDVRPEAEAFNCVTFIEASLAVARCRWAGRSDGDCVGAELTALRYRGGREGGWARQLHYFEAWLTDNAERQRLALMSAALGGTPTQATFFFISTHPDLFPAMRSPAVRRDIARQEGALSVAAWPVVDRDQVDAAAAALEEGDIVAIVGRKPGLLVTHTGFVHRGPDGRRQLLHASSAHGRVVLIPDRLEDYVARRAERRGIVVARPLPPA